MKKKRENEGKEKKKGKEGEMRNWWRKVGGSFPHFGSIREGENQKEK